MAFLLDAFLECASDEAEACFVPNAACSRTPKYRFNLRCNATLLCFVTLASDGIVAEVFSVRLTPVRRDAQSAEKVSEREVQECKGICTVRCRGRENLNAWAIRGREGRKKNLNVKLLSEALLCKKMETKKKLA